MTAVMSAHDGLSIELTVALEIGILLLAGPGEPEARQAALSYNLSLWRCIARLAAGRPDLEDCHGLSQSAAEVAAAGCREMLTERNRRHARALATRFTPGALRRLLEDWRASRRTGVDGDFSRWMLDRIEAAAGL